MNQDAGKRIVIVIFTLLSFSNPIFPQAFSHKGLVSGWLMGKFEEKVNPQLGFRYIPEIALETNLSDRELQIKKRTQ